jgi:hypothetical protein
MKTLVLCIAPLALLGCGKSASYTPKPATKVKEVAVNPGDEAKLFPLVEGNQWVYTVETQEGAFELTLKVTSVRKEGTTTNATITSATPGRDPVPSEWRVDSTGIYQISDGAARVFDPPQLLVAFPLEKGVEKTQTVNGPFPLGGGTGTMQMRAKYVGVQQVDTDMERLSAAAVESVTTWQTENGQAASRGLTWWTPGIGFVRQRQEVAMGQGRAVVLMKLKSYSFK